MTCAFAAENGHLHVLRWARENGCPWDENTCAFAKAYNHVDIVRWVTENGCPQKKMS